MGAVGGAQSGANLDFLSLIILEPHISKSSFDTKTHLVKESVQQLLQRLFQNVKIKRPTIDVLSTEFNTESSEEEEGPARLASTSVTHTQKVDPPWPRLHYPIPRPHPKGY